jgi:hypothetical protein
MSTKLYHGIRTLSDGTELYYVDGLAIYIDLSRTGKKDLYFKTLPEMWNYMDDINEVEGTIYGLPEHPELPTHTELVKMFRDAYSDVMRVISQIGMKQNAGERVVRGFVEAFMASVYIEYINSTLLENQGKFTSVYGQLYTPGGTPGPETSINTEAVYARMYNTKLGGFIRGGDGGPDRGVDPEASDPDESDPEDDDDPPLTPITPITQITPIYPSVPKENTSYLMYISIVVVVLLIIIGLIIFFLFNKKLPGVVKTAFGLI